MTRRRLRRRWAVLLGATVLGVVLMARPAAAQSAPDPASTTPPPVSPCAAGDGEGRGSSIVPDDCWGRFPSSHYDIGCDEGAWNHISRKVYCTFTGLAYEGARTSTAMALWLVEWSYGFDIYERLGGHAISIANTYDRHLIGPLRLGHFVWFLAIAWAGATGLRGRLALAAGELATSIVVAMLAAVFMANPGGYLHGMFNTMGSLSGALFATANGEPPPESGIDAEEVLAPLQAQLHSAFVEQPYDYLNWGGPLTGTCAEARDRVLADGPHGTSDDPRNTMKALGCDQQADFNHDPNGSRLFGAVLTLVAALIMVVLIALVAVTVVVAQMVGIVLFALFPFALLTGILPGGGRTLAWSWLGALGRVILAVVGMSFVLSLLLLTVQALLATTADVGLVERFALINIVVATMFIARKRILAAGHNLANQLAQRMATRRPGGERGIAWAAAPAVAGVTGFALGASVGSDHPSRTGRFAGTAARNQMANRRLRKHHKRSERRARRTTARERTEITVDAEGNPRERRAVTIDGPAPRSRRARATRARLERKATVGHTRNEARRHPHRRAPATARTAATRAAGSSSDRAASTENRRRGPGTEPRTSSAGNATTATRKPSAHQQAQPSAKQPRHDPGWVGDPPSGDGPQGPVDPEEP